ncbi:hypothetical protein V0288_22470 [Pannus brasiliensis CCIBt3594]|uniref:Uncharacterized protein n=1 Tax=Pannus brasiliensis CCIBt3594 TaxID=1427578 RepID=A0AAW9QXB1_9CHRO
MKLSEKTRIILLISILFLTAILMTRYFEVGMTGILAFFVTYLSKGLRKVNR